MKKHYAILSILIALLITFTVLTIVFFHEYKDITREIVGKELSYDFSSLFPIGGISGDGDTTPKERPDTSALAAKADNYKLGGIIFLVLAILVLAGITYFIIRIIRQRKTLVHE